MPTQSSRNALRNLLLVLAIAIGVLIYAYGWTVTDVNLTRPQEASRQNSLTNALREMLSPRIFDQDRVLVSSTAPVLYQCEEGDAPDEISLSSDGPSVSISPTCGSPGDLITVRATGFAPGADAQIRWVPVTGQSRPRSVVGDTNQLITMDENGGFEGQIEVPRLTSANGQIHQIEFRASVPDGAVRFSDTANEVLRRMAETVFMALVATTLAIPVSVMVSFFAAHNLMRGIRMPLGSAMLWVIILPIGYLIGSSLLGAVGRLTLELASGREVNIAGLAIVIAVIGVLLAVLRNVDVTQESLFSRVVGIGGRLVGALVVALVVGAFSGLCLTAARLFADLASSMRPAEVTSVFDWLINALADGINGFATMSGVIGGIIELLLTQVMGLLGGFMLASAVVTLVRPILRTMSGVPSHVLGAILGCISGALLMLAIGTIGMSAALFGLLPALVAGLMAGGVARGLTNKLLREKPAYEKSRAERLLRWLIGIGGTIAGFVFTFMWLDVGRALIIGALPNNAPTAFLNLPQYLVQCAAIGLVLGGIAGGLSGVRSAFGIGNVLYNVSREILNALRSIEPLIMGIIFVIWVGIGPFAGVLALMLHSIASLGKLYSEQIETIDSGPIEALESTGANHLQTIIYAVVPQIVPPYIAFTMYRWDINVRMSTIIGFVGGGGIGLLLNQQISLLRYRDAGVAVLAIAVVVSILDYASAKIRESVL